MQPTRSTAILTLTLPGIDLAGALGIDPQRPYDFGLSINGKLCDGGQFRIPLGDRKWREVQLALSQSTAGAGDDTRYRMVLGAGAALYKSLCDTSPDLAGFLIAGTGPRRLVIESERPEIHQLPWEAMVDKDWQSLANVDISIVRCLSTFNQEPDLCRAPLRVCAMFGPETERRTATALTKLKQDAARYTTPKLVVSAEEAQSLPGDWSDNDEEVIHIEAHGDPEHGGIVLKQEEDKKAISDAVVQRLQKRKMIFLWSCYSSMIHPWGKSLASEFHNAQNTFVLSFATELHYDNSSDIANDFYPSIFASRDSIDPESAVVKQRQRLFKDRGQMCDWASMTVWMRQPLDLSAAVLDGPRLPVKEWDPKPGEEDESESVLRLRRTLSEKALPGRAVLIPNTIIEGPLPYSLVENYSGAVVHLRGKNGLKEESLFKALKIDTTQISSVHPADRFLALLEELKTYSRSLLIWSDVTRCEIQVVELMTELPGNLDIVFVSGEHVNVGPSIIVSSDSELPVAAKKTMVMQTETQTDALAALEVLEETGQYKAAVKQFQELATGVNDWPESQRVVYYSKGYWSFIRLNQREDAEQCVAAVEQLNRYEGQLLRANFLQRNGDYDKARTAYADVAENGDNATLRGRARLELAYLVHELGDRPLAEKYFVEAIKTLEGVKDEADDALWRSALGRGLRDYADLLVRDSTRAAECATVLRRSLAIHAFDDRLNQVAYALQTRGKLERNTAKDEREEERAEADFKSAAAILIKNGNQVGWSRAMREMAQHSFKKGRYAQAVAILRHAYSQLEKYPADFETEKGQISLQAARIFWRLGEILEANRWANQALVMLPEAMSQQRVDATNLAELTASLVGTPPQ